MTPDPQLVYDVGMHNGDDTAYYLHKGYRVIAIEANPLLVHTAQAKFGDAIAAGRLRILNVGIAEGAGEAEFYIAEGQDLWSSFDRQTASRAGHEVTSVRVQCLSLGDVIRTEGLPHYVKIDVEGSDRLCIDSLTPDTAPAYLSIEMAHADGDRDIRTLAALGYRRFRCIRQNDLVPIHPGNVALQVRLRRWRARPGLPALTARGIRRVLRALRRPVDSSWEFPAGASGTFGEAWPGPWLSMAEMLSVWQRLHDVDRELHAGGLGEWFDVHAAR